MGQALEATVRGLGFSPPLRENHGMVQVGQWNDFFKELFSYCVEVRSKEVRREAVALSKSWGLGPGEMMMVWTQVGTADGLGMYSGERT